MTKDELQKGIRESFSLVYKKMLFWKYIGQLEQRIKELEEPILCHKCSDHIDGDGAICGVCASTQDTVINEQRERIAELEASLRLADEEYQNVIMLYYNEEYAPSNYERWIKAAYERWIKTEPEQEFEK